MRSQRILAALLVLALLTIVPSVPVQGDGAFDSPISVTDSRGEVTNLTEPAVHVASFGAFATNTLVDIGMVHKAVIFDAGSEFNKSEIPEMRGVSADSFVTVSSANKDMVVQRMMHLVDEGRWNKSTDVVIGYGYSYLLPVWNALEGLGFHVVTFYPDSYDGIVQVVEDIESITGASHDVSGRMVFVKEHIAAVLEEEGITNDSEKVPAVYVSYSGNVMWLANTGSVTADFITFAGGVNVAEDPSKSSPRYSADLSAILQLDPRPDIVLLDGLYPWTAEEFKSKIGSDDIIVYKLNKSWNSYCPDAAEGLWAVAHLFYPEYFEGELPVEEGEAADDGWGMMVYGVIGIAVVAVAVAAVLLTRRRD